MILFPAAASGACVPAPGQCLSPPLPSHELCSAVGGLDALRGWLGGRLFMTDYRPVPLAEHVVLEGKVYHKVGGGGVLG